MRYIQPDILLNELEEFKRIMKENEQLVLSENLAPIEILEKLAPENVITRWLKEWNEFSNTTKEFLKKFGEKKSNEYNQLFFWYGRDIYGRPLSMEEVIQYYKPIENESNSEWDFISVDDRLIVELTDTRLPGNMVKEVQKKFNVKHIPFFEHKEIFLAAKEVILKKLGKPTNHLEHFHRLVILINAIDGFRGDEIFFKISSDSEYFLPNVYRQILIDFSQNNKCKFKNGEVIFVYGQSFNKNEIFMVNNYILDTRGKVINNNLVGFFSKVGFLDMNSEDSKYKEAWGVFSKRMISDYQNGKKR